MEKSVTVRVRSWVQIIKFMNQLELNEKFRKVLYAFVKENNLKLNDNFYKEEFKNFKDMCTNTNCKHCEITKLKTKHKKLDADCVIIYFAIKLLKDV